MRSRWYLSFLALLCMGCIFEQLAGTEVGNPELTVSARFRVTGNNDSMAISELSVNCMGMEYYTMSNAKTMLWTTPNGHLVDVASPNDSIDLPPMKTSMDTWTQVDVMLKFPLGDSSLPDKISYHAFNNPRYAKLRKKMGPDSVPFLFELPGNPGLKLIFAKARIDAWHRKDSINMEIEFDAAKWIEQIPLDLPNQARRDGLGAKYIVLGPSENAVAYNRLKAMLPLCFRADSTENY